MPRPQPFSRRGKPLPDVFSPQVSERARLRIVAILAPAIDSFRLTRLRHRICEQHGTVYMDSVFFDLEGRDSLCEYTTHCNDEEFLDLVEFCFQVSEKLDHDELQRINHVFREEGAGYELMAPPSRYADADEEDGESAQEEDVEEEEDIPYGAEDEQAVPEPHAFGFPQIIRKPDEVTFEHVMRPALRILGDPRFSVANDEVLAAFDAYRRGNFDEALTDCGSCIESVLKTICALRGWPFDPERDTAARLVGICKQNHLFPPFYEPHLLSIATIRNRLSDAHGRGPAPAFGEVREEQVEHMLAVTLAATTFLVRSAQLAPEVIGRSR